MIDKTWLKSLGRDIKNKCIAHYNDWFENWRRSTNDNDSKLALYSKCKKYYTYSNYLDIHNCSHLHVLTKFRLSAHWLPIERGRYSRPILSRANRTCLFCKEFPGNEFHVLMECTSSLLGELRGIYLNQLYRVSPNLRSMSLRDQLMYIMSGHDLDMIRGTTTWLNACNDAHKIKYGQSE